MQTQTKKIIFIFPYLNVNTTSAERFKSFIIASEENTRVETEVITCDYRVKRSYFSGLSLENIDFFLPKNHQSLTVKFNFIQRIAFWSLNKGLFKLWRAFQLLHLIFYHTDVFYPGDISKYFSKSTKETIVFCSGSHFSLFSAAKSICDTSGYKLVIDYRDPWTFGYQAIDGFAIVQKLKAFFGRKKELIFLESAALVTTVSESLKAFFPAKYQYKIRVISNGSNFTEDEINPNPFPTNFNLVYAGTIYNQQLKEETFFEVFKLFLIGKDNSKIKLQFLGADGNVNLTKLIKKYSLESVTYMSPRLAKADFLNSMNNASAFIHLRFDQNRKVISSKLAEYLNFKKNVILPVSDNGDIAESILENHAGFVCDSYEDIQQTLNLLWEKHQRKESAIVISRNYSGEARDRRQIAKELIEEILLIP